MGSKGIAMVAARTQCIRISSSKVLIAMPDGRCWFMDVGSSNITTLAVTAVAAARSSLAASAVEGAIVAGLAWAGDTPASGPYTLLRYLRWLAGNYVFAGQTPGLFRRAADRFEASGRPDLAEFTRKKAKEEEGHADLAYRDLEALGLPATEAILLIQPPSADAFADRFRAYVESNDPITLFGFSYCLERMAIGRDEAFVRNVQSICPSGSRAVRFLKVHSNIGSDSAHVHEQLLFFESFDGSELASVTRAAFETAEMLAQQPQMDRMLTDEETRLRLRGVGVEFSCMPETRA